MRRIVIAAGLLMACGTAEQPAPQQVQPLGNALHDGGEAQEALPSSRGLVCLPVVAAECGCVYDCGVGEHQPNGSYLVTHSFWKGIKLEARIAQWCSGNECTDAFHAAIVCDGICAPRPADPTCHFEGDDCVTGQP